MPKELSVGLVGATGLVGSMMRSILAERHFPMSEFRCFASSRSAGQTLPWGDKEIVVEDVASASFDGLDVVLMSAGAGASCDYAEKIAASGAVVIDNSSAWRMHPEVPLVVSEVNPHAINVRPKGIVANPNCTTMVAMPVIKPLHEKAGLTRMVASTYQAVSGTGVKGVEELDYELQKLQGRAQELASTQPTNLPEYEVFPGVIANNVLSIAGNLVDDETDEEHKFRNESRKILEIAALDVTCTCIRVPVFTGHSLSITAEFESPISVSEAAALLVNAQGVELVEAPNPMAAAGGDVSLVGRLRQQPEYPNRISMFVSGYNLRKGAALNAVQLAELLLH